MNNNFKFLELLSTEDINFLKQNIQKIALKKDTILFYKDDICKDILLLESGEVSLYVYGDDNDEQINLYCISSGEQCITNTASALSQTPVIANAVTLTDINAYLLPFSIAKKLMHMNEKYENFIFYLFSLNLIL